MWSPLLAVIDESPVLRLAAAFALVAVVAFLLGGIVAAVDLLCEKWDRRQERHRVDAASDLEAARLGAAYHLGTHLHEVPMRPGVARVGPARHARFLTRR